jgi:hypothetical protein
MMQKLLDLLIDEHLGFPEEGAAGVRLTFALNPMGYGGAIRHHETIEGIYVFTTAIPGHDGSAMPLEMMFTADAVQWISVAPDIAVIQPTDDATRTPGGVIIPSA